MAYMTDDKPDKRENYGGKNTVQVPLRNCRYVLYDRFVPLLFFPKKVEK